MFYIIPTDVGKLYRKSGLVVFVYTVIKWSLTPFEKMEEYIPKKGKIFDLGCGNGLFSNYLALKSQERKVIGIDYSEKRITLARMATQHIKNVVFNREDVNAVSVAPCDCIIFSDFLHHLSYQSQEDLIQRSFESLNKNGVLVIKEIDKKPKWKFAISFMLDTLLNINKGLFHRDASNFVTLLTKAGFGNIHVIPIHKNLPLTNILYICQKP